jgi:hypothetical protein
MGKVRVARGVYVLTSPGHRNGRGMFTQTLTLDRFHTGV